MPAPYTGDATRILLSFGMKSGGHLFSQWLRNKLMKSLNYYSTNSVYLDTVSSRDQATEHNLVQVNPAQQQSGTTYVAPDRRFEKQEGFTTIGAMNKGWNEAYSTAMSQASVMIVILTPDYTASEWCMKEWGQFQEENMSRRAKGRTPIYGLVVRFASDMQAGSSKPINLGGVDVLIVPKVETTGGSSTALRSDGTGWAISESSYEAILDRIRTALGS